MGRSMGWALAWMLVVAAPVLAQTSAPGRVEVVIPPVVQLEVESAGEEVTEPEHGDARGVLLVRVTTNTAWQLTVVDRAQGDESDAVGPVRIRGRGAGGPAVVTQEYTPIVGEGVLVAWGGAGTDQELLLEYRRPAGTEGEAADLPVSLQLLPR